MATHSSVLAWRIPGMGEPGGLPSMGSHRVGHDWSDGREILYSEAQTVGIQQMSAFILFRQWRTRQDQWVWAKACSSRVEFYSFLPSPLKWHLTQRMCFVYIWGKTDFKQMWLNDGGCGWRAVGTGTRRLVWGLLRLPGGQAGRSWGSVRKEGEESEEAWIWKPIRNWFICYI